MDEKKEEVVGPEALRKIIKSKEFDIGVAQRAVMDRDKAIADRDKKLREQAGDIASLRLKLTTKRREVKDLRRMVEARDGTIRSLKATLGMEESNVISLKEEVVRLMEQLDMEKDANDELRRKAKGGDEDAACRKGILKSYDKIVQKMQANLDARAANIEELRLNNERLKGGLAAAKEEARQKGRSCRSQEIKIQGLKSAYEEAKPRLERAKKQELLLLVLLRFALQSVLDGQG